jgi:hypothetical protein
MRCRGLELLRRPPPPLPEMAPRREQSPGNATTGQDDDGERSENTQCRIDEGERQRQAFGKKSNDVATSMT